MENDRIQHGVQFNQVFGMCIGIIPTAVRFDVEQGRVRVVVYLDDDASAIDLEDQQLVNIAGQAALRQAAHRPQQMASRDSAGERSGTSMWIRWPDSRRP